MSNNTIDALVYSAIKNNLTVEQMKQVQGSFINTDSSLTDAQFRDQIMDNTTIKRACSMYYGKPGVPQDSFNINVRIPTPEDYQYDNSSVKTPTQKKFGYIDKLVNVPASMCDDLDVTHRYQNSAADDFMSLYCRNMYAFYLEECATLGTTPSDDEFGSFYKPECACYIDKPSYLTGDGIPATCFAPGCSSNDGSYLDPNSRNGCSVTICQTNLNLSNVTAGESVNVNSKVSQACGNQIAAAQGDAQTSQTPSNTPSQSPSDTPSQTPSNTPSQTPSNTPSNTSQSDSDNNSVIGDTVGNTATDTSNNTTNATVNGASNNMTYIIIGIVGLLLLCCCCFVLYYFMSNKKGSQANNSSSKRKQVISSGGEEDGEEGGEEQSGGSYKLVRLASWFL